MTTNMTPTLRHDLRALERGIAAQWLDVVARSSFAAGDNVERRRQLAMLTGQIMDLLAAEPFPRHEAERLGAAMSRFQCMRADVLGTILEELPAHLVTVLSAEDFSAIQPWLSAVTTRIMVGFLAEDGARVVREQHAIHQALLMAQRQAQRQISRPSRQAR
jgi:hypothetical protein